MKYNYFSSLRTPSTYLIEYPKVSRISSHFCTWLKIHGKIRKQNFPIKIFPRITRNLNYGGKKFHAEILLPDFSIYFLLSAKRAAYTRDFRVMSLIALRTWNAPCAIRIAALDSSPFWRSSEESGFLFRIESFDEYRDPWLVIQCWVNWRASRPSVGPIAAPVLLLLSTPCAPMIAVVRGGLKSTSKQFGRTLGTKILQIVSSQKERMFVPSVLPCSERIWRMRLNELVMMMPMRCRWRSCLMPQQGIVAWLDMYVPGCFHAFGGSWVWNRASLSIRGSETALAQSLRNYGTRTVW